MSHQSLTRRGYCLKKKYLTAREKLQIQKELCFKPIVLPSFQQIARPKQFYTYLESEQRYYVPRYYGIETFGQPIKNELGEGEPIDYKVYWDLLPHQEKAWAAIEERFIEGGHSGILSIPCGWGKCHGKDTQIMMYDGSIKMVQDIQVGDQLMGDDSTPRTVLSLARGQEQMYKVIPKKGDPYVVNESHILSLKSSTNHSKKMYKGAIIDISLKDWLNLPKMFHARGTPLRAYRVPITFPKKEIDFDPYILGHWLGDGHNKGAVFTSTDEIIIDYYRKEMKKLNLTLYPLPDKRHDKPIDFRITTGKMKSNGKFTDNKNDKNKFYQFLVKYDLLKNKHVPHIYKCNSKDIQLQILAGYLDADGYYNNERGYDVISKDEQLIDDIIFISRSLGFAAYKQKCQKTCTNSTSEKAVRADQNDKFGRVTGTYYRTNIHGPGIENIPVKIEYKKCKTTRKQIKDVLVTGFSVEKLDIDNYYGFTLDGNSRYLLGDFQVTHNTYTAIRLGSFLKKKMLVVVNKEFLMNQWIDAIKKCSNARVGIIQQNKVDIENKDIVVAMLHSVAKKDYPEEVFQDFGYCVVDECHHIASQMFSQALPKIASQHMLGLSATPYRKDGLTPVFMNYLGPLFYSERRSGTNQVWIKFLEIDSQSVHFAEEIQKKSGNKDTVKMINNISEYETLNYFVLDLVKMLLEDKPRKVLVLGSRREQLEWLNDNCMQAGYKNHKGKYVTSGLYYGNKGMNKKMYYKMLEESAGCDVIWGTNEIASEGLDIPDLNTLILLNGGLSVEQAVGRILRKFHKDTPPLVIDMVYRCGNFQKHGRARKDYYDAEDYNSHKMRVRMGDNCSTYLAYLPKLKEFLNEFPEPTEAERVARRKKQLKVFPQVNNKFTAPPSIRTGNREPMQAPKNISFNRLQKVQVATEEEKKALYTQDDPDNQRPEPKIEFLDISDDEEYYPPPRSNEDSELSSGGENNQRERITATITPIKPRSPVNKTSSRPVIACVTEKQSINSKPIIKATPKLSSSLKKSKPNRMSAVSVIAPPPASTSQTSLGGLPLKNINHKNTDNKNNKNNKDRDIGASITMPKKKSRMMSTASVGTITGVGLGASRNSVKSPSIGTVITSQRAFSGNNSTKKGPSIGAI